MQLSIQTYIFYLWEPYQNSFQDYIYLKYIRKNNNRKPKLYVKLEKTLYGTLKAALLFWRVLLHTIIEWGFKLHD